MDQISNEAPFFCLGLESEDDVQPVTGEEMKSESVDFCIDTEAEFTVGCPLTEDKCMATASEGSDLVLETSAHENSTEIALSPNMLVNEQSREVVGTSTELPADMWDSLTYEESIVSFECDQDSWKFENFDDEQFNNLVSQYMPAIPDNDASASALSAETHDSRITNVPNSICLSNMETELNEILGLNGAASTLNFDAFGAARPIGDQNLGIAQQPLSPADAGNRHSDILLDITSREMQNGSSASDFNLVHKAGVTFEQRHSINNWIQNPNVNGNSVSGSLTNKIIIVPANCENSQATGSDSQDDLSLRATLLPESENYLICDNSTTETDLFCDEQHESGDNIGMNCDEIISGPISKEDSPLESCKELAYSKGMDFMGNEKFEHNSNMTSIAESQSEIMTDSTDNDVASVICSSELPNWHKNDTILSHELGQEKSPEAVLPCSSNSDFSSKNEDAPPVSEITMTVTVCKLGHEDVEKESSQIAVTVDNRDLFIQNVEGKDALSAEPELGCSNPPESLALESANQNLHNKENNTVEVHEIDSDKNSEPLLTKFSKHEELLDSDSSSGEVLLLEYANQEETCGQVNEDVMSSEHVSKSPDQSSTDEDSLPGASLEECQGQVFPRTDAALSVSDNSELPLCENSVQSVGQVPIDNGDSQVEDVVESLVLMSSNQMHKETSNSAELISLPRDGKDILLKNRKDSRELFDVVHLTNEDGLPSEILAADELSSQVFAVCKSIDSNEYRSSDKKNRCTSKLGENLIVVDDTEDSPPTDCDINDFAKHVKKEKPWTFGNEGSAEEDSWKDPIPYGHKECFCPHGVVSVMAGHFHCQECGLATLHKSSIMRHEIMKHRVKHSGINIMHCRLCPSVFVHSSEFRRHSRKHARKVISDAKGEEQRYSDSSVTQSSESSAYRSTSVSPQRCRRSLGSWNWKLAFDCQNEMEQRSKKRKSDQMTGDESSAVGDKPDEVSRSKLAKLNYETEKEAKTTYYNATELGADGRKMTVKYPSYDGVLLSTLTKPSYSCPICHRRFTKLMVQKSHYAQVHQVYLEGTSVYKCKPCAFRSISLRDFEIHIQAERHRIVFGQLKESGFVSKNPVSGCTLSQADAGTLATGKSQSTKRRQQSSNCSTEDLQQLKKLRYSNSSEKMSPHTTENNRQALKRNHQNSGSIKVQTELSQEISSEKISWFYGNLKRSGPSPEIHLNACVSNHVCTSACVCGLAAKGRTLSKKKCNKKKTPVKKCGEGIKSVSSSELFQPVIVDSYSCLPSTWTTISDNTTSEENWSGEDRSSQIVPFEEKLCKTEPYEELPSQFASNTSKAIKFFQNTRRTFLTTSLEKTLNPPQNVPQIKPRSQVALKSTSRQTCQRMKDSVVKKSSSRSGLCKTPNREASLDCKNSIIIHLSDNDSESSHSENVAFVSGKCKSEVGVDRSKSAERSSDRICNKTFNCSDSNSPGVLQQDKTSVCSHPKRKSAVNTSSNSHEKSVLSDFSSDILCSELERRGFMKQCTCGVYFLSLPTYNLHCMWHLSGSPLRCSFCKAVSKDWYEFYSHIQNHCK